VGRHTYYGAAPDAPLYHREDDPPFAVHTYPELADLVAADLSAASELWRHPELATCVLRPCYLLGATRQGTLAAFLHGPRVPMVLGFDPLFQVMHEEDVAAAVVAAVEARLRGVFNVAGPEPTPLSALVYETGRTALPLPERLLRLALGRMGLPRLPAGAIEHLKYPVVVDASAFTEATGFAARYDLRRALTDFRLGRAP
jgi:UDP-glucose 4-epimerase